MAAKKNARRKISKRPKASKRITRPRGTKKVAKKKRPVKAKKKSPRRSKPAKAKSRAAAKKPAAKKPAAKRSAAKPAARKSAAKKPAAKKPAAKKPAPLAVKPVVKKPALVARPGPAKPEPAEPSIPDRLIGRAAPGFRLADHHGSMLASSELSGKPYVLYFYPKDDTPGCTKEACDFRDGRALFDARGVRVVGVSPDSSSSHERFRDKFQLPFTLLADTDKILARAYGVWVKKSMYGREYMGIERSTFLVDASGVVRRAWRGVKVGGHVDEVRSALGEL